jgi:hypothetical protein
MNIQNISGNKLLLFTVNVWIKNPKGMNIQNIIVNNLLLFAVNVWIKKPQVINIQNIFLGIISYNTSLKEASIIIEGISIF